MRITTPMTAPISNAFSLGSDLRRTSPTSLWGRPIPGMAMTSPSQIVAEARVSIDGFFPSPPAARLLASPGEGGQRMWDVESLTAEADRLMDGGRWASARDLIESVSPETIGEGEPLGRLLMRLGVCYRMMRDFQKALAVHELASQNYCYPKLLMELAVDCLVIVKRSDSVERRAIFAEKGLGYLSRIRSPGVPPKLVDLRIEAELLAWMGRFPDALRKIGEAGRLKSGDPHILLVRVRILCALWRCEEALQVLEQVWGRWGIYWHQDLQRLVFRERLVLLMEVGRREKVEELRAEARTAAVSEQEYRRILGGDWQRNPEELIPPSPEVKALIDHADVLMGEGKWRDALAFLEPIPKDRVAAGEEMARLLQKLGTCHRHLGDIQGALGLHKLALEQARRPRLLIDLAIDYLELTRREGDPVKRTALCERGLAFVREGEGSDSLPLRLRIESELLAWSGRLPEALAVIEKGLELAPWNSHTLLIKARLLSAMGRAAEAIDFLKARYRDAEPSTWDDKVRQRISRELLVLLMESGNTEGAREWSEQVLADGVHPGDVRKILEKLWRRKPAEEFPPGV